MASYDSLVLFVPVLLLSVVAHEYAHARVAVSQGDPTPLMLGRLTMNPLPHVDPVGTVLVPLILFFSQAGFIIGWAKPVPVNTRNFRNYRKGDLLVSAAGVTANFALALLFFGAALALSASGAEAGTPGLAGALRRMAEFGLFLNLLLGVFNLIPVPPLDGSHLLYHLLPPALGARYRQLGRYGIVLLFLVILVPGLLGALLFPVRFLMDVARGVIESVA
ncbi:MAG: site-2 protease family protein [Gemmatimonadota bacterium]|jgi:Zn-dependent protease|nr:MAG: site-2 protease family protein [Gemmatimonadota bacterium]